MESEEPGVDSITRPTLIQLICTSGMKDSHHTSTSRRNRERREAQILK